MKRSFLSHWRASFFTGLAVVLPAVMSIGILVFLFGTVANFTDKLLFFLPTQMTHADRGMGPVYWYWSLAAIAVTIGLVTVVGGVTRVYIGRRIIGWADSLFLRIPLLNKIYSAIKQVNEAVTTNQRSSFREVVLVQFPRDGMYSVGFITGDQHAEVQEKTREKVVSVFVPTTPNPTTGFLILVPEEKLTRLSMSVSDGIKFIISIGTVQPEWKPSNPPVAASVA
jgi:uncharacterized membrane protein